MSEQSEEVTTYVEQMRGIAEETRYRSQLVKCSVNEQMNDVEDNLKLVNTLNGISEKWVSIKSNTHLLYERKSGSIGATFFHVLFVGNSAGNRTKVLKITYGNMYINKLFQKHEKNTGGFTV